MQGANQKVHDERTGRRTRGTLGVGSEDAVHEVDRQEVASYKIKVTFKGALEAHVGLRTV